mmetsp:Transcript_30900/g.101894  ORF Transcript_30900/g.101894 Transcript_30900/m.101894 type:complete len:150 (+) Transcript_30900:257-706(+)
MPCGAPWRPATPRLACGCISRMQPPRVSICMRLLEEEEEAAEEERRSRVRGTRSRMQRSAASIKARWRRLQTEPPASDQPWSPEEGERLTVAVQPYLNSGTRIAWKSVKSQFPGWSPARLQHKWESICKKRRREEQSARTGPTPKRTRE